MGFQLISERLAMPKLRMTGGKLHLLSGYAPHSGHSYGVRKEFFDQLEAAWKPRGEHAVTMAMGDMNAKLFHRSDVNEDTIGRFVFESPLRKDMAQTNRELLLEVCGAVGCCIANIWFAHTTENLVTCRTLGTMPKAQITPATFSQIDHCLVASSMMGEIANIWTDRGASLQTQHYLMQVFCRMSFPKRVDQQSDRRRCDVRRLGADLELRNTFSALFCAQMAEAPATENLDEHAGYVSCAMQAASAVASVQGPVAKRPWISQHSPGIIKQREEARRLRQPDAEKALQRQVRAAVKRDRQQWIEEDLAGGSWSAIKALRKGKGKRPVQVRDSTGALVDSDKRGDTMADYFENVQWKVSFADVQPTGRDILGATLPILTTQFTLEELTSVLKTFAVGKAAGDSSLPENYRPIALLPVGYKVLAMMLQKRLQQGGAEDRIRHTQFGFRPGRSTVQAIAVVRRMFEAAYSAKTPGLIALLLDWAKAFDRIRVDSMMSALQRFGLPTGMLEMIASIYEVRRFVLKDNGGDSSLRVQRAGIAQGCPLSPYLCIIVQTVLLHDVDRRLQEEGCNVAEPEYVVCGDVLYADDTQLISSSAAKLQRQLECVVDEGKRYGLELNWTKTLAMRIRHDGMVTQPSGEPVKCVEEAVYLGGLLSATADAKPEVTRRLGEARGSFKALAQCWAHANILDIAKWKCTWPVLFPSYFTT